LTVHFIRKQKVSDKFHKKKRKITKERKKSKNKILFHSRILRMSSLFEYIFKFFKSSSFPFQIQ
jgi:hypothetical protein